MKTTLAITITGLILGIGIYYVMKDTAPRSEDLTALVAETERPAIGRTAVLETNFGSIEIGLYEKEAPKTTNNFIDLAEREFYNGLTFHRVIAGFMIQGGDPNSNGTGGPGYQFEDELDPATLSAKEGYRKGVVAMANAGPNTNGSQFFIMVADYDLPHQYTIFGRVTKGQDATDQISRVQTKAGDKPLKPVIIQSIAIR